MSLFACKICLTNYCKHVSYSGAGYLNKPFGFLDVKYSRRWREKEVAFGVTDANVSHNFWLVRTYFIELVSAVREQKSLAFFKLLYFGLGGERNPFRKLGYVTGRRIYTTRFTYPLTPLPTRKNGKLCRGYFEYS